MTSSELRAKAREILAGRWGKAVWLMLAYGLFIFVMSFIQGLFPEESLINSLIGLAISIINVALSFGFIISFIRFRRNEEVKGFDFIGEGFSRFSRAWGIAWQIFLKLLIPMIIMIVLFIFLGVGIGVTSGSSILNKSNDGVVGGMAGIGFIVIFALSIYIAIKSLLYALSYYIAYDNPELSAKECVEKSAELMIGNRGRYIVLQLSFIGWAILATLTFCIGFLWLAPYMQVAQICFYEDLAGVGDNNNVVTNPDEIVG